MATIRENLNKIKQAVYGIEVRDAIHDSIEQCYNDVSASETLANAAASRANTAAQNADSKASSAQSAATAANTATEKANTATGKVNDAISNAELAAQAANDAAENANAKAGLADTAAQNANDQTTLVLEAVEQAETATQSANSAAEAANSAAEKANASSSKADTAAEKADASASKADTAAEKADASATKADTSAANADEKAQAAQTAADNIGDAAERAEAAAESANSAAQNANEKATLVSDAIEQAESATQSANEAAGAANTAAEKANDSSSKADASAEKADASAENADEKAKAAQTAADNIGDAAERAETATQAANEAAENANEKATLAQQQASAAEQAAKNADTATTSANEATQSANDAAEAANTAAEKANDSSSKADASAAKADTSAANADEKAQAAQTAADSIGDAAERAEAAAESANTAAQNANEKATLAEQRATAAETAAKNADTATTSANAAAKEATAQAASASTATASANSAAQAANDAADNANTVAEDVSDALEEVRGAVTTATEAANNASEQTLKAETLIKSAQSTIDAANTAAEKANTAADGADLAVRNCETAAGLANDAANTANTAAENANAKAELANQAIEDANSAVSAANDAVSKANEATQEASSVASDLGEALREAETAVGNVNSAIKDVNAAKTNTEAATEAAKSATTKCENATEAAKDAAAECNKHMDDLPTVRWYSGTAITGQSSIGTPFPNSGISYAHNGDMYLNTGTSDVYRCMSAGTADLATWAWQTNIQGLVFTPSVDEQGNISWSNNGTLDNPETRNIRGPRGFLFTPTVSEEGVISWTNDGELENPEDANIKGPQGEPGKAPQIGQNGDWEVWDNESGDWTATGVEAQSARVMRASIPTDGWSSAEGELSSVSISLEGIDPSCALIADLVQSGDNAQDALLREAWPSVVRMTATESEVTVYAEEVPEVELPFQLFVVETREKLGTGEIMLMRRGGGSGTSAKSIERAEVELDQSSWTYDGSEHSPKVVSVTLGGQELVEWKDYVYVSSPASQAGEYSVIVMGLMEYGGAKNVPWKIEKATGSIQLSENPVTLKGTAGTTKSVTITKVGDGQLEIENRNSEFVTATLKGDSIELLSVESGTAEIEVRLTEGTNYTGASVTLSVEVEVLIADPVFENNSWETIASICAAGKAKEFWRIGDKKAFERGGKTYHFQIIDFDHDNLDSSDTRYSDSSYNGGKKKAAMTLMMEEVFTDNHRIDETNSNSCSWRDSEMRLTTVPQIKTEMPAELTSVLRKVTKKTATSGSNSSLLSTADDLFLASEIEVFGNSNNSAAGEGTYYEFFKASNSRIKKQDGTAQWWWLRSPSSGYGTSFLYVYSSGGVFNVNADNTNGGVVLCACI